MEILSFLKKNPSIKKSVVAAKFGIPPSTLSTIMKNKDIIQKNFKNGSKTMKNFNTNDTGLFLFQCLLNKMAKFQDDECKAGKQNKAHMTILLTANQHGTEKLLP